MILAVYQLQDARLINRTVAGLPFRRDGFATKNGLLGLDVITASRFDE